jgi:hypothetical protein
MQANTSEAVRQGPHAGVLGIHGECARTQNLENPHVNEADQLLLETAISKTFLAGSAAIVTLLTTNYFRARYSVGVGTRVLATLHGSLQPGCRDEGQGHDFSQPLVQLAALPHPVNFKAVCHVSP